MQLLVDCKERWQDMTPCVGGRFCGACAKPVIDFTAWPREQVIAHLNAHPDTCGQYLPEQLDPSLVPLADVTGKARRGFLAALAAFTLSAAHAQQRPDPAPTEQVPARPSKNVAAPLHPEKQRVTSVDVRNGHLVCPVPEASTHKRRHRHVYLSPRFPFIQVRYPHRGIARPGRRIF